ncbi:MAG: RNA polymerase sporulation sigma factor SigH, partial [Selenomonadaceae bacterium]|nr:RNA polymerase sporulation sigma factor SigH [Selenomonadaceae bacterium]
METNTSNDFEVGVYDDSEKYETLTDEELIVEIKDKMDNAALEYLIQRYRSFVRAKARSYFLIGADREDIIQEGMIGFYKAIRDFKSDKLSSFHAFAELCVTRQIITAIKTATRQKHIPLNSYVSLNKPIYDEDSDRTLLDVISGVKVADPE